MLDDENCFGGRHLRVKGIEFRGGICGVKQVGAWRRLPGGGRFKKS